MKNCEFIKIELSKVSANILWDLLTYEKLNLVIAMKKDVFKDNDYLIKVIDEVNNQIRTQIEEVR